MNPKALHKISYGLYIVSSIKGNKINGQIANSVFQITSEPKAIAIGINKLNLTHEYITQSGVCSISILNKETPMPFIGVFGFKSGRDIDKFQNVNHRIGVTKTPIVLDHTLAYIELVIIDKIDVITHSIFIGRVKDADVLTDEKPMTYEYYQQVKGGISPKNAPTYISPIDSKSASNEKNSVGVKRKEDKIDMTRYVCSVCGYIYDPKKGDPDGGIKPGTRFEDLPDEWVCPVCGASKDKFEKEQVK